MPETMTILQRRPCAGRAASRRWPPSAAPADRRSCSAAPRATSRCSAARPPSAGPAAASAPRHPGSACARSALGKLLHRGIERHVHRDPARAAPGHAPAVRRTATAACRHRAPPATATRRPRPSAGKPPARCRRSRRSRESFWVCRAWRRPRWRSIRAGRRRSVRTVPMVTRRARRRLIVRRARCVRSEISAGVAEFTEARWITLQTKPRHYPF